MGENKGEIGLQGPSGSGFTTFEPVLITATSAGAAQTVHTGSASTTQLDFLTLWANNADTSGADVDLVLLLGGTSEPADVTCGPRTIFGKGGSVLVLADEPIGTSKVLQAYASVGSKITLKGYIKRVELADS